MSDITFMVDDKIIYAHSLELMKRSRVFRNQLLPTLGQKKLIPIVKYKYDSFYRFLRFIYTDQCGIYNDDAMELLKLAVDYKVVRLENRILDFITGNMNLRLFEFCVLENYSLGKRRTQEILASNLNSCLQSEEFLTLHPDTVEEILKFNSVDGNATEEKIFEALVQWIEAYCQRHDIKLSESRQHFDRLIQLIRFPTMKLDYIRDFKNKYPDILTKDDLMAICSQVMLGPESIQNNRWNPIPRVTLNTAFKWREFVNTAKFETKYSVTTDSILTGIRFDTDINKANKMVIIRMFSRNNQTKEVKVFEFTHELTTQWMSVLISFGEPIRLQPNFLYTIAFDYMISVGNIKLLRRSKNQKIIVHDPLKCVKINQKGDNISEMFFSQPE